MNGPMLLATVPEELGHISKYLNEDLFERKSAEQIVIPKQRKKEVAKASEKSIEEIIEDAKVDIYEETEEEEEFELPSIAKRKERNIKEKRESKWRKY